MKETHTRYAFTLIELLIVIAVIGILAALLMPSLARARYRAKEVVCINNIKQQALGVIAYAGDYDSFYPGLKFNNGGRADYHVHLSAGEGADFTDLLEDYWGKHAVSFDSAGSISDDPLKLPPNTFMDDPRYIKNDYLLYFGYQEYRYGTNPREYIGEAMKKVGDSFLQRANLAGPRIKALLSDVMARYYDHPRKQSFASHSNMDSHWIDPESTGNWFLKTYRRTEYYQSIHPRMSGHFGAQDGSVRRYMIPGYSYEGFVKFRAYYQVVPKELTE